MSCYEGRLHDGEGRCGHEARYAAKLHSSAAPRWLLCEEHAAQARADEDVEWIESLLRAGPA